MDKTIIVLSPNPHSSFTTGVCEMLVRKGYPIEAIVVRKLSYKRFKEEFKSQKIRLLKKIWEKLILRGASNPKGPNSIRSFRKKNELTIRNIKEFKKHGSLIVQCDSLNDQKVEDLLNSYNNKLVLFTGGGIIRKNILDVAGDGIINCHMGILPDYRGMDLLDWCVLENKINQIGITLHFMNSGIDTGDILRTIQVPIENETSLEEMRKKFESIMIESMVDVVDLYLKNQILPIRQDKASGKQYFTLHKKLSDLASKKFAHTFQQTQ